MQKSNRIYGLDALRAIAMLLGILLHAIIAYKVYPNPTWPSDNQFHSYGFDGLYVFIHSFRMQLFYLVAGFFARMLYLKIGEKEFFKHRFKRIGIPFIASMIFILPISIAPFLYNQYVVTSGLPAEEGMAAFWHRLFRWNGMAHLWFLYYLLFYYAVMLVAYRIKLGEGVKRTIDKVNTRYGSPLHVLVYILVLTGIQVVLFGTPEVEVSTSIFPKPGHFTYYGFFFLLGIMLHRRQDQLFAIAKYTWLYLGTGLLLTALVFKMLVLGHAEVEHYSFPLMTLAKLAVAAQTVLLTFGFIGFFLRYMNVENATLKYISDASFWLYLIHLSIVGTLQIVLLYTDVPGWLRPWTVLAGTTLVAMVSYHWLVRYTFIGTALHGQRKREQSKATVASS